MHGLGEFPLGVYVEGWDVVVGGEARWLCTSLWCVHGLGELGRTEDGPRSEGGDELIPRTGGAWRGWGLVLRTERARPGCRISLCVLSSLDQSCSGMRPVISGRGPRLRRHFALYQYPRP